VLSKYVLIAGVLSKSKRDRMEVKGFVSGYIVSILGRQKEACTDIIDIDAVEDWKRNEARGETQQHLSFRRKNKDRIGDLVIFHFESCNRLNFPSTHLPHGCAFYCAEVQLCPLGKMRRSISSHRLHVFNRTR